MNRLFFDIETLPSHDTHKETHLDILRKRKSNIDISDEEIYLSTSLEGTFGRICCIGLIKEENGAATIKEVFCGDEKEVLEKFWKTAWNVHQFIGHNIWEFDLPFIYKRSIINGIRPRLDISFARYRNHPIYDTLQEWELWGFGKRQKLDTLAKVLALPTSKDVMNGSEVWRYYQDGRQKDICDYCMKDVELVRRVYYKMTFQSVPEH